VLGRGLLSGKYREGAIFGRNDTRASDPNFTRPRLRTNLELVDRLKGIGAIYGKTNSQLAIRWVLDTPHVTSAIVGMKTPSQVEENMGALGWNLGEEDKKMMAAW
jgi:aryl-alcohol dehydrogenase-like predicted oxidoreductase